MPARAEALQWRKAKRSANNGACVEVTTQGANRTLIRDSKSPEGDHLIFSSVVFKRLTDAVKGGSFDLS